MSQAVSNFSGFAQANVIKMFQTVSHFSGFAQVFLQRGKCHKNVSDSLKFFGLRPGKCHKNVSDSLTFFGLRPGVFVGRQMSQDILIISRHWGIFAGKCLTTFLLFLDITAPKIQANVARDCRDRYTPANRHSGYQRTPTHHPHRRSEHRTRPP